MNKRFATGVLLGIAALASPAYAQNGDGNGGLSGAHYNLNILGKERLLAERARRVQSTHDSGAPE